MQDMLSAVMRTFVATRSVVVVCFYQTAVQAQSWQHFSTPDDSLSVELPAKPNVLKKKNDSLDVIFKHSKSAYSHTVNLGSESEPEILFSVLRVAKAMSNRDFDKTVNSNMLWIGGDDKHFSRKADVIVNGLHGREFVFEKGDMPGHALFINGGTYIYYLIFQSETERPESEVVVRIFNSFRPKAKSNLRKPQQSLSTSQDSSFNTARNESISRE
jgi:hypothetical protein